ncbi:MAG: twin-arginine translocase TatA/TatE family subunit [Candidatus Omnitrophica bacterium]|nr:twin-arginine translocase TatA/TatE family subunit [Candidatus Omnitrophota bacterium]
MRIFGIGIQELLVILLICLLIFGAAKLPEIGRALGKTIKEFKKSMKEIGPEDEGEKR